MKATGLLSILIMLSNIIYLNAQGLPHDVPDSRSDELTVYLIYDLAVCQGICDAEVVAVVEGGQPPYYYNWSIGANTPEIHDQCAGAGYVTVTDDLGNSATAKYAIELLSAPTLFLDPMYFTVTQPSGGQNNGSIAVDSSFVLDPTGLYLDSVWSIDGINFTIYHIFSHLGPGVYHLYVRTIEGCTVPVGGEFILYDITSLENLTTTFNLFPNPVSDMLQVTADLPLTIELLDLQGRTLFVSDAMTFHQIQMNEYPEGIYIARISDGRGSSYKKILKVGNNE